ncbi:MAG: hypothetical protein M1814_005956 [Vezdaea aestivalis]|nr:MAG: hypothetical protein M1814_005956 [Vezdaea aestivalis]
MAPPVQGSFWYYAPNKGAPIAFGILFLISGVVHAYQTHRYKSWRFTVLFSWAAIVFVAGFILREIGAYNYGKINIFIASTVMLYCAPPIYAGANYFILARTLYYAPYASPMHPGRIASTFSTSSAFSVFPPLNAKSSQVGIDVLIEILTGNGASRFANSEATPTDIKVGASLIKASLLMQTILQIAFTFVVIKFHRNYRSMGIANQKIGTVLRMLYGSTGLILARSIFRTVENFTVESHANDYPSGELIEHEVYFYVFEASIMLINTYFVNLLHPGRFLPKSSKTYLAKDGVTERQGPGWVDKRPFILTVVDPCDIFGLLKGKDKETMFWEQDDMAQQQNASQQPPVSTPYQAPGAMSPPGVPASDTRKIRH